MHVRPTWILPTDYYHFENDPIEMIGLAPAASYRIAWSTALYLSGILVVSFGENETQMLAILLILLGISLFTLLFKSIDFFDKI